MLNLGTELSPGTRRCHILVFRINLQMSAERDRAVAV
jgi:hypothetical protein